MQYTDLTRSGPAEVPFSERLGALLSGKLQLPGGRGKPTLTSAEEEWKSMVEQTPAIAAIKAALVRRVLWGRQPWAR